MSSTQVLVVSSAVHNDNSAARKTRPVLFLLVHSRQFTDPYVYSLATRAINTYNVRYSDIPQRSCCMEIARQLQLAPLLAMNSFFLFGPRATGKTTLIRQQS